MLIPPDLLGFGGFGREVLEGDYPHKTHSLFAQAYRLGVPITAHVGIGYDIVHEIHQQNVSKGQQHVSYTNHGKDDGGKVVMRARDIELDSIGAEHADTIDLGQESEESSRRQTERAVAGAMDS